MIQVKKNTINGANYINLSSVVGRNGKFPQNQTIKMKEIQINDAEKQRLIIERNNMKNEDINQKLHLK